MGNLKENNILDQKSVAFALRVIRAYKFLVGEKQEFVMSKQLLRSGTAIGALVREAEFAESRNDFIHKLSIALKEANETDYWLTLLHASEYIGDDSFFSIQADSKELIKILVSIIKTTKGKP